VKRKAGAAPAVRVRKRSSAATPKSQPGPLFDPSPILALGRGKTDATIKQGAMIFRQGDTADAVYYLRKGVAQVSVTSKQGKVAIVATLRPGDFFGEGCLAGQPRRMADARAMGTCVVTRVQKKAMIRLLQEQSDTSEAFVAHLLARNIQIEEDLVDQMFNSSERRLARLLLMLANFAKEGEFEPVIAKISQEALAARVGTTRARVNYFMNKFRKLGYIEYNGRLKVHTSLLNVVIHD
jgi:CRP/FNR family cyclic AMP-dependent transcriptional regulator